MNSLFQEFNAVSPAEWENKILRELNISSLERLNKYNEDRILIKPFYTSEDVTEDGLKQPEESAGLTYRMPDDPWRIQEELRVKDPEAAAHQADLAVNAGADIIAFIFPDDSNEGYDIASLFRHIDPLHTPVVLEGNVNPSRLWSGFKQIINRTDAGHHEISGAINYDPLGFLTKHGDYPASEQDAFQSAKEILLECTGDYPYMRSLLVDGSLFFDAGSTIIQELAFTLAMGKEYLEIFSDTGISVGELARHMGFRFAAGKDFFMEMAKLRVFRRLWPWIVNAYNAGESRNLRTYIHSRTASRNLTVYDPHDNILRLTTSAMSAIFGGTDALTILPFDSAYHKDNGSSTRLARNVQLILRHESYFNKISNPAAGSYYIDTLTRQLAETTWLLFQEIEKRGGYRNALKNNLIQDHIHKTVIERDAKVASAQTVIIGTNRYPIQGERFPESARKDLSERPVSGSEKVRLLTRYRVSEPFETLRRRTEKSSRTPEVFLAGMGDPAVRSAKEAFASNFFAMAGFSLAETGHFLSIDEMIENINREKPDIVVYCCSPEDFFRVSDKTGSRLGKKVIQVFAGDAGTDREKFESSGVHYFVSRKSNILGVLEALQSALGITEKE